MHQSPFNDAQKRCSKLGFRQPFGGVAIAPYVITLFLFAGPDGLAAIAWLMMLVPTLGYLVVIGAIRLSPTRSTF
jgi:hypothetical protein